METLGNLKIESQKTPTGVIPNLIGKTEDEAKKLLKGWKLRCIRRDGVDLVGIMNYDMNRINVAIDNNIITKILKVG